MNNENSEFNKLFEEARNYFDSGNYDKAIECFEKIPPSYENYNYVSIILGWAYGYKGEDDKAIECLEKIPNNYEDYNNVLYSLGLAYFNKKEYDKSIECLEKIPNNYEDYNNVLYSLGLAYFNKKEHDKSIECLEKIPDSYENYNNALFNLGAAYTAKGEYDEAIECLEKIPNNYKDYNNVLNNLSVAYGNKGKYDKAIECLEKIPTGYKNYDNVLNMLGLAYLNKGAYDKAIEYFEKIPDSYEYYNDVLSNLGAAYTAKGEYDKAIECLEKIPTGYKNYNGVLLNLGAAYLGKDEYDKSIEYFKKVPTDYKNYNDVLYNLGIAYLVKGEHDKSIEYFAKSINLENGYTDIYLLIKLLIEVSVNNKSTIKRIKELIPKEYFNKDNIFKTIVNDSSNNDDNYIDIWFYQAIILYMLSVKTKGIEVSHYLSYEVLKKLIGLKGEEDKEPTIKNPLRMMSLSTANDPKEGNVLIDALNNQGININARDDENLIPFQVSFTKNKDSLTMFRLYGKQDNKEATGVCLVFNSSYFDVEGKNTPTTFYANNSSGQVDDRGNTVNKKSTQDTPKENKENQKHSLFYILYYDDKDNILVFNRKKENRYEDTIKIQLDKSDEIESEEIGINDDNTSDVIGYCFKKIFEIINSNNDKQYQETCYKLLINLRYLIKHQAFFEETELRLLKINNIKDPNSKIKIDNETSVYQQYLEILDKETYIKEIILGTKIENAQSKVEVLRVFLKDNDSINISVSKAPFR